MHWFWNCKQPAIYDRQLLHILTPSLCVMDLLSSDLDLLGTISYHQCFILHFLTEKTFWISSDLSANFDLL